MTQIYIDEYVMVYMQRDGDDTVCGDGVFGLIAYDGVTFDRCLATKMYKQTYFYARINKHAPYRV